MLARMSTSSRGCYEENAPVNFSLTNQCRILIWQNLLPASGAVTAVCIGIWYDPSYKCSNSFLKKFTAHLRYISSFVSCSLNNFYCAYGVITAQCYTSAVYAVVVCLSVYVCVCVRHVRYCNKTAKPGITQTTPHNSPTTTLGLWCQKCPWFVFVFGKIDAYLCKALRWGYNGNVELLSELLHDADMKLFKSMLRSTHCIHQLLHHWNLSQWNSELLIVFLLSPIATIIFTNIHLFYDVYLMEHTNCLCLLLLLLFTSIVCSIFFI